MTAKNQINNTFVEAGWIGGDTQKVFSPQVFTENGDLEYTYKIERSVQRVKTEDDARRLWHKVKYCEDADKCTYLKYFKDDGEDDNANGNALDGNNNVPPRNIELLQVPMDETFQATQYLYAIVMLIMLLFIGLTIHWRNKNAIKVRCSEDEVHC